MERENPDLEPREGPRPLYHDHAWVYDSIFGPPREPLVRDITSELQANGIERGSSILDAGCGTGGYAVALAESGFWVTGVDQSEELINLAGQKGRLARAASATFRVADLRRSELDGPYDAVLARGVLNDFVTDDDRQAVLESIAGALRRRGVLLADVRDWEPSRERIVREPTFQRSGHAHGAQITFKSETRLDAPSRQLRISESITVIRDGQRQDVRNHFVMRCWSRDELDARLRAAGFQDVVVRPADRPDRMLVTAAR